MTPLDPRWVPCQRRAAWLKSAIVAIVLAGGAAALVLLMEMPATPVVIVAAVILIVDTVRGQWWPAVTYRRESYALSERALEIRRGVLWRSVIDVPRSRIQHSDVSQGPLERSFGLGTLSVYTAGMKHALVRLQGLDHARAMEIRDHLLQTDDGDVV